jgi:hypothetical protein
VIVGQAVEATCQREEVKLEWKKNDGIRISNNMPGALTHPVTGEKIWCNHSAVIARLLGSFCVLAACALFEFSSVNWCVSHLQTFHPAMAHQEYLRIARYQNKWRFYLWAALAFFLFAVKTIFKQQRDFPLNTLYGQTVTLLLVAAGCVSAFVFSRDVHFALVCLLHALLCSRDCSLNWSMLRCRRRHADSQQRHDQSARRHLAEHGLQQVAPRGHLRH